MEVDERSPIEEIDGWIAANQCTHPPADCGKCAAKSLLRRIRSTITRLAVESVSALAKERDLSDSLRGELDEALIEIESVKLNRELHKLSKEKTERERDVLKAAATLDETINNSLHEELEKAERERDEARSEVRQTRGLIEETCADNTSLMIERDEALALVREALKHMEATLIHPAFKDSPRAVLFDKMRAAAAGGETE